MTAPISCKTHGSLSSCAFRGQVAPLKPGRVQHRRLPLVQIVHAKKRSEDVQEEAVGGLQGLFKGVTSTISSRGGSKSQKASPTAKLSNKAKPDARTQSSRGGTPLGGSPRKQASGPQDASPTKKQEGRKLGTFSLGSSGARRSDSNTVFVAGATGRLGCRVVLELLRNKKLKVRAGARNPEEARSLVKAATDYGLLTGEQARRLTVVPVDLEDEDSIAPAVGNAGRVVQAIGAAETKLLDFGAPSRIDGEAAIKLVNVSKDLGIKQYIMVTSLGTTKLGFPASILNLFWGVLLFKKKAEKALQASGIPYVIVRPGGMEKPTDAYKRTHNVRLAPRDKLFGGQVSRLQVAELIAAAVSNPDVAENKVLEVVAEENAQAMEYVNLLTAHPTDGQESSQPQQDPTPKLGTAKQQVGQKAQQAKQTASKATSQAASQVAPDAESAAEDFVEAIDSTAKSFFQSAEDLDKQRLEAQQKRDADMKQERADRAKRNAELLAKQKAEQETQAKKQAEEDKRKEQQKAKKDAEAKAAADKKKKKDAEAKAAEDAKKKSQSKPPPPAEPKKTEAKAEPKKTEAKAAPKEAPKAAPKEAPKAAPKEAPKAEPKKKTEGKAESSAAQTPEAKEQAKRAEAASKEAREWINNWKNGKAKAPAQPAKQVAAKAAAPAKQAQQAASDAASSAEKPARDLMGSVFSGIRLPWQQGNGAKQQQASSQQANQPTKKKTVDATSAAGGSADTLEQRQKEARKWINDWRARTLETKLPKAVSAKK